MYTSRISDTTRLPFTMHIFFFNDPAPPEIYTLSLHDALPISACWASSIVSDASRYGFGSLPDLLLARARSKSGREDRKSTRLNSSHMSISYAVFCLKKKIISTSPDPAQRNFDT